jgi:hypothetical protein
MPIIFGEWLPVPEVQCRLPNELISAVGKWMPVQEALRRLKGAKAKTKAKAELLKPMRSGALPTGIRATRLRNGYAISHPVWQYPVPSYWDEKDRGNGVWQIPEGEDGHAVVLCEGYVDFQTFNELFLLVTAAQEPTPKLGRIDWDDFWKHERARYLGNQLPSEKAYLKEAEALIRDRYGVNTVSDTELRRFMRALYDGKTKRPKSTDRKRRN